MDDDRKIGYFFLGLGIGVAAGLLFAPKSGEETRRFLLDKAEEGKEFVKRRGEDWRDSASEVVERSKSALARQKDNLSAAVEAGKAAYRDAVATGSENT